MNFLIARKHEGETRYYRGYDGVKAQVGAKGNAVRMDRDLADKVLSQLEKVAGAGWYIMEENERPK